MTSRRPVFIVFEGLDGSGKTTAARRTAEVLGAVFLTTPSAEVRPYRDRIVGSFAGCQEAAQLFYLATVFSASDEIDRLLASGKSVVLDRYFLSTQAYAEYRGSKLRLDALGDQLRQPDLTVFLHAPLEVRRARILDRGEATAADRETLAEAADEALRDLHVRRKGLAPVGRWIDIDSHATQVEDLTRAVERALGSLGTSARCSQQGLGGIRSGPGMIAKRRRAASRSTRSQGNTVAILRVTIDPDTPTGSTPAGTPCWTRLFAAAGAFARTMTAVPADSTSSKNGFGFFSSSVGRSRNAKGRGAPSFTTMK